MTPTAFKVDQETLDIESVSVDLIEPAHEFGDRVLYGKTFLRPEELHLGASVEFGHEDGKYAIGVKVGIDELDPKAGVYASAPILLKMATERILRHLNAGPGPETGKIPQWIVWEEGTA